MGTTYKVDASKVEFLPANVTVTVEEELTGNVILSEGTVKEAVEAAITANAPKVENADTLLTTKDAADEVIKIIKGVDTEKNGAVTIEVSLQVDTVGYVPAENNTLTTVKYDIYPVYKVTKDEDKSVISEGELTTTKLDEEMEITVPLPTAPAGKAFAAGDKVLVKHYAADKATIIDWQMTEAKTSKTGVTATFTTNSFCVWELTKDSRVAKIQFMDGTTFVKSGDFYADCIGNALPKLSNRPNETFKGWEYKGKLYTVMDETLFAILAKDSETGRATLTSSYSKELNHPITSTPSDPNAPTVTIGVTQPENGTLSVEPKQAKAGEQVTVTVTPSEKYYVATSVTAKGDTTVTATKNANGTFTFTMPAGNTVTVTAEIKHIFDLFTDVPADSFYADPVKWAVEKGITLGNSTDYSTFGTTASCTRAQMVVFLYRAAGSPDVTGTTNSFTDLPADEEIRKAVQWAVDNGITQGTSETTFAPNNVCDRGQMVTFLYRYMGE